MAELFTDLIIVLNSSFTLSSQEFLHLRNPMFDIIIKPIL